jgi:hypothetical protein
MKENLELGVIPKICFKVGGGGCLAISQSGWVES